jgi:hypothetical protein
MDLATAIAGPMTPALSSVQNPKINGKDFFEAQGNVGLTPTLSWDPPALGTPSRYSVRIRRLRRNPQDPTTTIAANVGTVFTPSTSLTIPPGVLQPGAVYAFRIRAFQSPTSATSPHRLAYPTAFADVLSNLMYSSKRAYVRGGNLGNFGGFAGGDNRCRDGMTISGLGLSSWKAWLSDPTTDAIDRIVTDGPWYDLDGRLIFANKAAMTAASGPANPFTLDQFGTSNGGRVWTGTNADGTHAGQSCGGWLGVGAGLQGNLGSQDSQWTSFTSDDCTGISNPAGIYCFEQ